MTAAAHSTSIAAKHARRSRAMCFVLTAAALSALLLAADRRQKLNASDDAQTQARVKPAFRDKPHSLPPLVQRYFSGGSPEAAAVAAILQRPPHPPLDGRVAVHLMRVYGTSAIPRVDVSTRSDLLSLLAGHGAPHVASIESPLIQTRHGVRYRSSALGEPTPNLRENHRDIFLATFAECGVPLSTPVQVDDSTTFNLSALLADSIAHFDLKQRELEWSAIAYTLYLSDRRIWHDRDGNAFTFDQLAEALMRRDLTRSSCGGAHVLLAMTYLLRVDNQTRMLSHEVREMLRDSVRTAVQTAVRTQQADGSWINPWGDQPAEHAAANQSAAKFVMTSHLLEWLEYLPLDLQPPSTAYTGAGRWLILHLQELSHAASEQAARWICPWSHAASALRDLCSEQNL